MVIQRSWKILSETCSASVTEANRPSTGLSNSSSDDSNCSNQTMHSIVTSVVSPIDNTTTTKTDLSRSNVAINNTNSSEMIQKFQTTPQIAEYTLQKLRQRYNCFASNNTTPSESAMHSLELVRITVQNSFDQEISDLVKKFIEKYFGPALENIKENLGQNAVNEDILQKMSCALLENAKTQYKTCKTKQHPINDATNTQVLQQNAALVGIQRMPSTKSTVMPLEVQKRFQSENLVMQQQQIQSPQYHSLEQIITVTASGQGLNTSTKNTMVTYTNVNQLNNTGTVTALQPPRRQIYWNTAHISTSTKFVLDIQANKAFGFSSDGKERLASKHPELIRYLPDNEDRDWLIAQQIIPQQHRTSRFLFLIYDEVYRLYQTHQSYHTKANVDLSLMMTFTVADFIIQKMKIFFVDLNIKSRGLITNSYSITSSGDNTNTTNVQSNSHLRNALLQGVQATTPLTRTASMQRSPCIDYGLERTTINASNNNSNNATADSTVSQKSKSSGLSSSHATLTALLNNSNYNNNIDKAKATIISKTNHFNQSTYLLHKK